MPEGLEIERRFLIKEMPKSLEKYPKKRIEQYYLKAETDMQIRVRRIDGKGCFVGQKRAIGMVREEHEDKVSIDVFDAMHQAAVSKTIFKTRYLIPHGKLTIEVDVFAGFLEGLSIAEIEFPDVETAKAFVPLDWFAREVTDDIEYSNSVLAVRGMPNRQHIVDKKEGLSIVGNMIAQLRVHVPVVIVEVMGGSANNKTSTFAKYLAKQFNALVLSCDDYHKGVKWIAAEKARGNTYTFDQPEAVDLESLASHIQQLKIGKIVTKPVYNFRLGVPDREEKVAPKSIIIVEGPFAFLPPLDKLGDIKVFVDVGPHGRLIRRMVHDGMRSGWDPDKALSRAVDEIEPIYKKYIEPYKDQANIIIKNEYTPLKEADKAQLREYQVKFAVRDGDQAKKILLKSGASMIASTHQEDEYYTNNPRPQGGDEVVRLRYENGKVIFTYKGSKHEGSLIKQRPNFSVELNEDITPALKRIYKCKISFAKQRDFFMFGSVIIAVDNVSVNNNKIGDFIEAQMSNSKQLEKLSGIKKALGLKEPITKSYLEMISDGTFG